MKISVLPSFFVTFIGSYLKIVLKRIFSFEFSVIPTVVRIMWIPILKYVKD